MVLNTLEYTKAMQTGLDQHIINTSTTGWMEENAGQVNYNGGKEIKIPTISTTGLGDYDRDKGFDRNGSVTLAYQPYTMTQDRGTSFQLDAMDVNETNFVASATNVIGAFQTDHVIPEIDAYRYATLAAKAKAASQSEAVTLDASTAFKKFQEHVRAVRDYVGQDVPLICSITSAAMALIEDNDKFARQINVADFKQGTINTRIKVIDDVYFRIVPSARMHDKFIFNTGESEWGFKPDTAGGAKELNWIICPQKTPLAISKTEVLRIFDPMTNQKANAWKIDYRKYHDLWVLQSRLKTIMACTKA